MIETSKLVTPVISTRKSKRSLQKDMVRSSKAFIVYLYREIVFLTWMTSQEKTLTTDILRRTKAFDLRFFPFDFFSKILLTE